MTEADIPKITKITSKPNFQYLANLLVVIRYCRDYQQPVQQVNWNAMWAGVVCPSNPVRRQQTRFNILSPEVKDSPISIVCCHH